MSLIKCGTDENGSYIELKRPRGETPLCFIDECGVVHDTIRIYEYKAVSVVVECINIQPQSQIKYL